MRAPGLTSVLGAFLSLAVHASGAAADPAALNHAASLYHQARFDSARARMESLLSDEGWRRRDSLMLYQYLGMASSRLGADADAVSRFGRLLELDSLFQFARNEDPDILRNFAAAREARRQAALPGESPRAAGSAVIPAPGAAMPHRLDAGTAREPAGLESALPGAPPPDPLRAASADGFGTPRKRMNLALGAVPLGGGWLARERTGHAVTLGLLQGGGALLSLYASQQLSRARNDRWGAEDGREVDMMVRWQWVQAVSLSTAVGAYLFSIFASGGG
jgi:hypothetical protein